MTPTTIHYYSSNEITISQISQNIPQKLVKHGEDAILNIICINSQELMSMQRAAVSYNNISGLDHSPRTEKFIKYSPKTKRCYVVRTVKHPELPPTQRSYDRHAFAVQQGDDDGSIQVGRFTIHHKDDEGPIQAGRFTIRRQKRDQSADEELARGGVKPIIVTVKKSTDGAICDWRDFDESL